MFIEMNGEVFRVLKELEGGGCYVISTTCPTSIIFIDMAAFERAERVVAPESFSNSGKADSSRLQMIQPLLEDEGCITDRGRLLEVAGKVAAAKGTTKKRILRLFHNYLGTGRTTLGREVKREQERNPIFDAAIRKFYFSAKRLSLKESYALMLAESFTEEHGSLKQERPSFNSFRHYFYRRGYNKMAQREIAREGLTSYQRNSRPLCGSQSVWRDRLGTFQMDATIADIHLVDQYDMVLRVF